MPPPKTVAQSADMTCTPLTQNGGSEVCSAFEIPFHWKLLKKSATPSAFESTLYLVKKLLYYLLQFIFSNQVPPTVYQSPATTFHQSQISGRDEVCLELILPSRYIKCVPTISYSLQAIMILIFLHTRSFEKQSNNHLT